jgi:hypothetical protein
MLKSWGHALGNASLAWLALLASSSLGCTVRNLPMLELHRSGLVTPTGRVALEVGTLEHLSIYRVNYEQQLVARYRDLIVRVGVFPQGQKLMIDASANQHKIEVVDRESFYQLNGGERLEISTRLPDGVVPASRQHHRFEFDLPPPISSYNIAVSRSTLIPAIVERIEAREGDVHALYLPFLVDGEPFAIDMEFSVAVETRRFFAAPATP